MRVRSIIPHANPFGRGRGKPVGTEYDVPAAEAEALIAAGHVKRADGKTSAKPKKASATPKAAAKATPKE